jgi:hypothetical protein
MSTRYGTRKIFLATDDEAVIQQTKHAKYAQYTFVYLPKEMAGRQPVGGRLWTDGNGTVYEKNVAAMVDVGLLSECIAHVGKFSSNFDRVVYALMVARRGDCFPPFASLDWVR